MRFLLDTNILIPLEDSQLTLHESLADLVRLANGNGHQLVYHPASEDDINRDPNPERRKRTLDRLKQYTRIQDRLVCPWNSPLPNPNEAADNEILYALKCAAAHALVTEDRGIHEKAKGRGLLDRVYTIQTARDWLLRLHEKAQVKLPNIEEKELSSLTPHLNSDFFNSLREGYPSFNTWFLEKAREGKRAWVAWEPTGHIGALCIFAIQTNEKITEEGMVLPGAALKLCTFKVGPTVRGQKIGELFLKAAFRYATENRIENLFMHGDVDQHHFLFDLLEDFGFYRVGRHPGSDGRDAVYVKRHPQAPPKEDFPPIEYLRRYFPHFRRDPVISKYVVPIRPEFHLTLFPDYGSRYDRQLDLFKNSNTAGNAIKLAYLSHAQVQKIVPGDILLFYRSNDERAITSIGVVEQFTSLGDPEAIAGLVKRRTVYSMEEIEALAVKPTRVILFRLVRHLRNPRSQQWLETNRVLKGPPQSITTIEHDAFQKIMSDDQQRGT